MQTIEESDLRDFVRESNWIENIRREPTEEELDAHWLLLAEPYSVEAIRKFVRSVAGAELRDSVGMDVIVGDHRPPPGHPEMSKWLQDILTKTVDAHYRHCCYETLHPFIDGNGRSGRAIWLHDMLRASRYVPDFLFLRHFYYQTLSEFR